MEKNTETDAAHEHHNRENGDDDPEKPTQTAPEQPQMTAPERELAEIEIEKYLSEFTGTGAKVSLYRRSPMWCSGFLDQYPLDDNIQLEEIRDTWGGRRFEIRVLDSRGVYIASRTVTIADIPRHRGRALDDSLQYDKGGQVVVKNPAAETAEKTLEALERAQQRNQDLMLEMMKMNMKKEAPAPAAAPSDPTAQLASVIEIFKTMKEFASEAAPDTGGDGMNASNYLEIAKLFKDELGERRKLVKAAQEPKRIATPGIDAPPAQVIPEKTQSATAPAPEQTQTEEEEITIAEELAEAGPETTAAILAETFERWSPEQRQEAFMYFSGNTPPDIMEKTTIDEKDADSHNPLEVDYGKKEEDDEKSA